MKTLLQTYQRLKNYIDNCTRKMKIVNRYILLTGNYAIINEILGGRLV